MATEAPDEPKTRNRAKTESYDVFRAHDGGWQDVAADIEVTAFVLAYCAERGWDVDDPSLEQILEIRAQDGWKEPI
jgi:hypothetical protein